MKNSAVTSSAGSTQKRLGAEPGWASARPPARDWLAARGLPERYVLFVGNREPRKNLPVLLAAHAALLAQRADTPPLLLVGPAGWGPRLPLGARGARLVVIAGYLVDADLATVVAGAGPPA
jgi:glycosyltransferase involved in cell wall biosynthesis